MSTRGRPKGSASLASRLLAGSGGQAGIYAESATGRQVYVHALWKQSAAVSRLHIFYVGCGLLGRSGDVTTRRREHYEWLRRHWVPRTLLFIKPKRLENPAWVEQQLAEFNCPEGLVIFETPFLQQAHRVEARLIELYKARSEARFNLVNGRQYSVGYKAQPKHGTLRDHVVDIREKAAQGVSKEALAREYGVDVTSIRDVINRRSYKDIA